MKKAVNLLFLMLLATASSAENHNHSGDIHSRDLDLSKGVHEMLTLEMKEIRKGMETLVYAVASGQWEDVAKTAKSIKHGFILKQQLTESQRHELHEKLPHGFKQMDKKFHYYAGMLSHVAEEKDIELVHYFVYKMNEACTACHTKYASSKFKGLQIENKHAEHMH